MLETRRTGRRRGRLRRSHQRSRSTRQVTDPRVLVDLDAANCGVEAVGKFGDVEQAGLNRIAEPRGLAKLGILPGLAVALGGVDYGLQGSGVDTHCRGRLLRSCRPYGETRGSPSPYTHPKAACRGGRRRRPGRRGQPAPVVTWPHHMTVPRKSDNSPSASLAILRPSPSRPFMPSATMCSLWHGADSPTITWDVHRSTGPASMPPWVPMTLGVRSWIRPEASPQAAQSRARSSSAVRPVSGCATSSTDIAVRTRRGG